MVMTPSQAANRNARASSSRGRDTIGAGGKVTSQKTYTSQISHGNTNVYSGKDPIAFDTRSNTVSGNPKAAPDNKHDHARTVGDVMLRQEATGRGRIKQDMDKFVSIQHPNNHGGSGAMTFRIEDGNHAKVIDHDAPPK